MQYSFLTQLRAALSKKRFASFCLLVCLFPMASCFEAPQYPFVPEIDFVDLEFKEGNEINRTESLIVTIRIKDGDGDLGIDPSLPEYNSAPYNNVTLYQTNDGVPKSLIEINPIIQTVEHLNENDVREKITLQLLPIDDPTKGKLVVPATRDRPSYGYLPEVNCEFYQNFNAVNLAVSAQDKEVLDPTTVVETLYGRVNGVKVATYYVIRDVLYFRTNPNHYNIEVDFLVKDQTNPSAVGGFVVYNWRKEFCQQDLDGRFFKLTEKTGPFEGFLKYTMTSIGFRRIFSGKTLKLKIQIRDRAFNQSNTIFTREFVL